MAFADDKYALNKYLMYAVNGGVGKEDIIIGFPRHCVDSQTVSYPKDRVQADGASGPNGSLQ